MATALAFAAFLFLPILPIILLTNSADLLKATYYQADEETTPLLTRIRAGHKNLLCENLAPFVGVFFVAQSFGVEGLETPMIIFIIGRCVHFLGAVLNPPFARTVGFLLGWMSTVYMAFLAYTKFGEIKEPTEEERTLNILNNTCVFTLFLFVPYDLGRIPANGILKLTYYPKLALTPS